METLNAETFKARIFDYTKHQDWSFSGPRPVIVDFYADWCGPCRALSPILDEIAADYVGKVDLYKVNTELSPELSSIFGIRGIPSLLFIPTSGKPAMASGFMPKTTLEEAIENIFQVKR